MSRSVVGLVFARGGSKGVPGKNIRPLAGKPLIAHAIETALACPSIGRVVVSTDDPGIARVARLHGAEVPFMRPAELARDDSPEWSAWRHAVRTLAELDGRCMDVFVSVPATSPLRDVEDVERCIAALDETGADVVVTAHPAGRNPYFNMVVRGGDGFFRLAIQGKESISRRQDAPEVFDLTTVAYAARPEFILKAGGIFDGRVAMVVVPPERALDIDTELDMDFAEFLLARRGRP